MELLLVIEAEKTADGNARWVYAPYEVTVHELNLLLDEELVWKLKNKSIGDVQSDPKARFFLHVRDASKGEISNAAK